MTMVLSCTSPDYVFQVSDRRLSVRDAAGALRPASDETNKAVLWSNMAVFASAGRSHVGGTPVDAWIASTIASAPVGKPQSEVLKHIAACAEEDFRQLGEPMMQLRHAFVAVGWTHTRTSDLLVPFHVSLSNALESDGTFAPEASDAFAIRRNTDDAGVTRVRVLGTFLPPSELDRVTDEVRRVLPADPESALRALEDAVLRVHAAQPSGPVGSRLMSVCIPRVAADNARSTGRAMAILARPSAAACTFRYVSPNAAPEQFGPAFAAPGQPALMDWRGGDLPGGGQFSEVRFVPPRRR